MSHPIDVPAQRGGPPPLDETRSVWTHQAQIDLDSEPSNGALLERVIRLRAACLGLSQDLAATRRRMRALEAEIRELKQARCTAAELQRPSDGAPS